MEELVGLFALYHDADKSYLSVERGRGKNTRKYLCIWTNEEKIDQAIANHNWNEMFEKFDIRFETMLQLCNDLKIGIIFNIESEEERIIEYKDLLLDDKSPHRIQSIGKPAQISDSMVEDESVIFIKDDAEFHLIHKMDGDKITNTASIEINGVPHLVIFSKEEYAKEFTNKSNLGTNIIFKKDIYKNMVYNCLQNHLDIAIDSNRDMVVCVSVGYTVNNETEQNVVRMMAEELKNLN